VCPAGDSESFRLLIVVRPRAVRSLLIDKGTYVKKYVVTASLLVGLSMISGAASAQVVGTVGANYSRADTDAGDSDSYGVNGGITIPTGGSLAVLLDGSWQTNDDADVDVVSGSAHLISRNSDHAFGGFLGLANVDAGAGGDADAWGGGGEYAKFFTNSTLVGTVSYATADDTDLDLWGVSGEYRIFSNDNLRFDLGAGWATIDAGGGGDADAIQVGAGVEYRFAGSPFSIGGNLGYIDTDGGGDATVIGVTGRFDFGNESLKSRDRTGNTFGSFGGLAAFLQ
jgi:hypothetical protein